MQLKREFSEIDVKSKEKVIGVFIQPGKYKNTHIIYLKVIVPMKLKYQEEKRIG